MTPSYDYLVGFVFHPVQAGAIALIVVLLFAPNKLGPIGRFLGKRFRSEIIRRSGLGSFIPNRSDTPVPRLDVPVPKPVVVSQNDQKHLDDLPTEDFRPTQNTLQTTITVLAVIGLAAVIFWMLLHTR